MKKVPFDIDYYRKHKPQLVTRGGDEAEFLRFDDRHPVLPLYVNTGYASYFVQHNGQFLRNAGEESRFDIFMIVPTWKFWLLKCLSINVFWVLMLIPLVIQIFLTIELFNNQKYDKSSLIFGVTYGLTWLFLAATFRNILKGK